MQNRLTHIENKICQLRQKKERIQSQQALLLMREIQKILQEEFSPDIALTILKDHWGIASEAQKKEWKKRVGSFLPSARKKCKTAENLNPAS